MKDIVLRPLARPPKIIPSTESGCTLFFAAVDQILRLNAENLVEEVVDGEVVAINTTTGAYYSTRGSGVVVWERLRGGTTLGDIVCSLESLHEADSAVIMSGVVSFLGSLKGEGLLAEPTSLVTPSVKPQMDLPADYIRTPFMPPELEVFTDMKDLLLLDPIHEVGEAGWPNKK